MLCALRVENDSNARAFEDREERLAELLVTLEDEESLRREKPVDAILQVARDQRMKSSSGHGVLPTISTALVAESITKGV